MNSIKLESANHNRPTTTISISRENYQILKKIGYASECDTLNETITKILSKVPRVSKIDVET
jgi:hypothetical protein